MPANEKVLGTLHEAVAGALQEQVEGFTEVEVLPDGTEREKKVRPSPALLGAAIAFLKNNNITADPTGNAEMANLKEALAKRRSKRSTAAELDAAAELFAQSVDGPLRGMVQ